MDSQDYMKGMLEKLTAEKTLLLRSEAKLMDENDRLKETVRTIQSTCQSLARQIEGRNGQSIDSITPLNQDFQRLQIQGNKQIADLTRQLEFSKHETVEWKNMCAERDGIIQTKNRQLALLSQQNTIILDQRESVGEQARLESKIQELQGHHLAQSQQISAYKEQMQLYVEDFTHERNDREQAQSKVIQLESELIQAKQQLEINSTLSHNFSEPGASVQEQGVNSAPNHEHGQAVYRSRGGGMVVCDGNDIIDSLVESTDEQNQPSSFDLECPKCQSGYSIDQHGDFIEHVSTCVA